MGQAPALPEACEAYGAIPLRASASNSLRAIVWANHHSGPRVCKASSDISATGLAHKELKPGSRSGSGLQNVLPQSLPLSPGRDRPPKWTRRFRSCRTGAAQTMWGEGTC